MVAIVITFSFVTVVHVYVVNVVNVQIINVVNVVYVVRTVFTDAFNMIVAVISPHLNLAIVTHVIVPVIHAVYAVDIKSVMNFMKASLEMVLNFEI